MRAGRSLLLTGAVAVAASACGSSAHAPARTIVVKPSTSPPSSTATATPTATPTATTTAPPAPPPKPPPPAYPQLLPTALGSGPTSFVPAVRWHGQTAAWLARSAAGVALMSFDQRLLSLHLHSGTIDAGTLGWRFGPTVGALEAKRLAASFNGGFKLSTGSGGFESYGHIARPLRAGLGSIVTYSDGTTNIGSWHQEVPAAGKRVVAVRQNLTLLIDHGTAAATAGCNTCWGATLGGVSDPARSGLGITANGLLVWAGGEHLTPSQLADALLAAHVVRAVELDINPDWVAGYLYGHRRGRGPLAPVPALPDQHGIAGEYLSPWSRDFFTVVTR